jgi:hypothetical protein
VTHTRARLVLALLAGRGAFRATVQLAPLALAAAWGAAGFDAYASAMGLCAWAMFVAAAGEKAALKLVPRVPRLAADVTFAVLTAGTVPLAVAAFALASSFALVALAAAYAACIGMIQLLAGLHRLRGRALYDAGAYCALALGTVAATLLAAGLGWSPRAYLAALVAMATAAVATLAVRLPRRMRTRRRVAAQVLRTALLLGTSDLLGAVGVAVCYLALAVTGHRSGSGLFYGAALASGFCSAAVLYVLRLRQPATSVRQRGPAAAPVRRNMSRLLAASAVAAAITLALVVPLAPAMPPVVALAMLTVVEIPLFALVTYAGFRLENTDGRTPVVTATAAVAGLAGVAATAALCVPPLGAAGAMAALVAGLGVSATAMLVGIRDTGAGGWWRRRRFARAVRSAFSTVPRYREQWASAGTPLYADPPPVPVADVVTRADDLVPLRARGRSRPAPRTSVDHLTDPVLGRIAVRHACGQWHLDRRVHARVTGDGVPAFTLLDRRLPRLVDIALGSDMQLSTCTRHRVPVVTR